MNIFNIIHQNIIDVIKALQTASQLPDSLNLSNITVEPPKEGSKHGDIATNAAMVLAKPTGKTPQVLAELIAVELRKVDIIKQVEIAGPGFINIILDQKIWYSVIVSAINAGLGYGNSNIGKGAKVNLEYVSANPTGPMHIGHARGAVFGDALALLLIKAGFSVTKEFYINDAGGQIDTLAKSAYLRYLESLGEQISIEDGLYPGDYLLAVGDSLKTQYGEKLKHMTSEEAIKEIKPFAVDEMMALIKADLLELGIKHDIFFSEKTLHDNKKIEEVVAILEDKGLVYRGILEAPKGKKPEDWEEREQLLFKTTAFGDDIDRPLQKSNGDWTYFAAELAYIKNKLERGFDNLVMVLGADHGGYVKRTKAAVKALSDNPVGIEIKLCQLVQFMQHGEPMKMSKRAGTYITVRDVNDAVGKDIIRFMMLTRKNDMPMEFDIEKVMEQSKDNPVFYVQYAHARSKSILRNAANSIPDIHTKIANLKDIRLELLKDGEELALIKMLANWPRIVELAAVHYEPHRIAFYLYDLASAFHSLWNAGRENKDLRFITEIEDLSLARITLIRAVVTVIASGLFVLGVEPVEEM
jgi:arginyl-tRNA synthetase